MGIDNPSNVVYDYTPLTSLIGRSQQLYEIQKLLLQTNTRLITLIGPGGVGKTRLMLQVMKDARGAFADGVFFVPLAAISDTDVVILCIMHTLHIFPSGNRPLTEQLCSTLRTSHRLLLLDNFEHLLSAAPFIATLLEQCPYLKILVTSRARLHLNAEHIYTIPPLALPQASDTTAINMLHTVPAITLFVQRAQSAWRHFRLSENNAPAIIEICTRLDGLPLAIELAAARIKVLSPQAILARLDQQFTLLTGGGPDLPVRQQTLYNTIDWSYQLLSPAEQRLFRRLAVFTGGCTPPAIETVFMLLDGIQLSLQEDIQSLHDKSLLQVASVPQQQTRLQMLETIRAYGLERLASTGELDACQYAHAQYYLSITQQANEMLSGPQQASWLRCIETERDNIIMSLQWLHAQQKFEMLLQMTVALEHFWFLRGELHLGQMYIQQILRDVQANSYPISSQVKAHALYVVGRFAFWQNENEVALTYQQECLLLARQIGDHSRIADALLILGLIEDYLYGKSGTGRMTLNESLRIYREIHNTSGTIDALFALINLTFFQGQLADARHYSEECLTLSQSAGNQWNYAASLHLLGWMAYIQQNYVEALRLTSESAELLAPMGNPGFYSEALILQACEYMLLNDTAQAESILAEALTYARKLENPQVIGHVICAQGHLARRRNDLEAARAHYEACLHTMQHLWTPTQLTSRGKWVLAGCLEGLGKVAFLQEKMPWGVLLFGAAEAIRTTNHHTMPLPMEPDDYTTHLAIARKRLAPTTFSHLWTMGQHMAPLQALAAETTFALSPITPSSAPLPSVAFKLTAREQEILRLLARGQKNSQIAHQLAISNSTVNTHIQSIYAKLGVTTRSAATRAAHEHRLL